MPRACGLFVSRQIRLGVRLSSGMGEECHFLDDDSIHGGYMGAGATEAEDLFQDQLRQRAAIRDLLN